MTVPDSIQLQCRVNKRNIPKEIESDLILLTSLQAIQATATEGRNPIDVVVVLDRSFSMAESNKLELCKKTMVFMCKEVLNENDRLGLVAFDSSAQVIFPCERMTDQNKEIFLAKLNTIRVGDHTNLSAGVFQGLDLLKSIEGRSSVSALLVLSDGEITSGIMDRAKLQRMTSNFINSFPTENQPSIHCFGYGETYDEILTDLAQNNGGMFYHVSNLEEIPLAFADALGGLLHVAGQNISINVVVSGGAAELVESPITKCSRIEKLSACSWTLHVRDIFIGERKDILVKLRLPAMDTGFPQVHINITARFMDVVRECQNTLSSNIVATRLSKAEMQTTEHSNEDPEVKRHIIRMNVVNTLEEARVSAEKGDVAASESMVQTTITEVDHAMADLKLDEAKDAMLKDVLSDLRSAQQVFQKSRGGCLHKTPTAHVLQSVAWSHANQRANTINNLQQHAANCLGVKEAERKHTPSTFSYSTTAKSQMMAKAKSAFGLQ